MSELVTRLRASELFSQVSENTLAEIVESTPLIEGQPGESITVKLADYFILLDGAVDLARRQDSVHLASFAVPPGTTSFAWLYAVTPQNIIRVVKPSRYIVLDGERVDRAIKSLREVDLPLDVPEPLRKRADWLHRMPPFSELTRAEVLACGEAMETIVVPGGSDVVRQGQPGQYLYVVEEGKVEVWRSGPSFGPAPVRVATLGVGAAFGEEALLQESTRNATIRAKSDSRLLRLSKAMFDKYLRGRLVDEIDAAEAQRRLAEGGAVLIDCRYDVEYGLAHIPGARLMPLDQLRDRIRGLDHKKSYIVYCRTGSRSRAGAYVMRQAGLRAACLSGGIIAWPFDIEGRIGGTLDGPDGSTPALTT